LGTAIAMGLLRYRINNNKHAREQYKKLLWARFIEDWAHMVDGREELKRDMKQRNVTGFSESQLESEYESRMKILLNSKASGINKFLRTNYYASRVFFPWHRHFEIGFEITKKR
jgi:DNA phosphorothioation-dependent restriction protein DptG